MAGSTMDLNVRINAIDRYSREMKRLEADMKRLDGAAAGYGRQGDRPGAAVGRMMQEKSRQGAQAAAARESLGGMGGIGLPPSVIGAGALGLAMREVVTSAADFETSLTNIQKKAGSTAQQTAAIGEEIKALATDGSLAVSIDEIAAGYERGAAAGIPLAELRQFAALSAKGADAFEVSAERVADSAAGFNKVLGIPMERMERYFDLINGLADSGTADESGIMDYIDQGGAMAKTFGLSADQTAAFGAALANLKVSAAKGATATNSIFTKLLAPNALSDPARAAYDRLIKDDRKFRRQLDNGQSAEAFVGLIDSLRAMKKEARTGIIVDLFGQDHLDVMTQMVEGADELKRNLSYAAGDTWFDSLDRSYTLKLDDFWSQWQLVKNALEKLTIDAGTAGMPAFKAALDGALALIAQVDAGLKHFKATVNTDEVSAAMTAIGELGTKIGEIMQLGGEGSPVMRFFDRMAEAANLTSGAINVGKDVLQGVGLVDQDADTPADRQKRRDDLGESFSKINPYVGPQIEAYRDWANRDAAPLNARAEEFRERSMDDYLGGTGLPSAERPLPADRGGRVTAADPGRFSDAPPAMDAAMLDALRARLTPPAGLSKPPANLPDLATVPIPTPRPDVDTTAWMQSTNMMQTALNAVNKSIMPVADINTAPAMAKLAALRAEMDRTANYQGDDGGYRRRYLGLVDDQF